MHKKVLITGASGFVGFHLIEEAISLGFEVFAAVRPSSDLEHLKHFNIKYTYLNYNDVDALRNDIISNQYNYIIHASGTTKAKTLSAYNRVNADFTKNLALASVGTQVEKFVFVSSLAAVGPIDNLNKEIVDRQIQKPVTSYGESKLLAEKYLAEISSLSYVTIRPTAVYGPREKDIFILFNSVNKGLEPYIGDFDQKLSFIYVKDLVKVIFSAMESIHTNRSYNVSDGLSYDRYALALISKKILNKKTLKFHLPLPIVKVLASTLDFLYTRSSKTPALNKEKLAELTAVNWVCNIDQAKLDLNYQPAFNLERGLAETLAWYKHNHWL
jgi:nucleoside-diphosphate-sugar epimerase